MLSSSDSVLVPRAVTLGPSSPRPPPARSTCLVLLGADPVGDCPDADLGRLGVEGAAVVVALDTFLTDSAALADVVLPAAAFGEKAGSTTNVEGRVTEVAQRVTPIGTARADWMVAAELADRLGYDDLAAALTGVDAVTDAIAAGVAGYRSATAAALRGSVEGVLAVAPAGAAAVEALGGFAATDRNSYDYRLVVSRTLYDRAVGTVNAPSLAPLAPAVAAYVNPADADKIGAPLGSPVRLVGAKGTDQLPARGQHGGATRHRAGAVQPHRFRLAADVDRRRRRRRHRRADRGRVNERVCERVNHQTRSSVHWCTTRRVGRVALGRRCTNERAASPSTRCSPAG